MKFPFTSAYYIGVDGALYQGSEKYSESFVITSTNMIEDKYG